MQKMLTKNTLFTILDSEEREMDKTYKDSILMGLTVIEAKIDNKEAHKRIKYIKLKYNTR